MTEPSTVTFNAEVSSIVVEPNYEQDTELVGNINQPDPDEKNQTKMFVVNQQKVKFVGGGKPELVWSAWEAALEDALAKRRLFQDSATQQVSILVSLRELAQNGFGSTTSVRASYVVVSDDRGDVIFSATIESTGKDNTFMGVKRIRRAVGASISNNIEMFLKELEMADIDEKLAEAQAAQ